MNHVPASPSSVNNVLEALFTHEPIPFESRFETMVLVHLRDIGTPLNPRTQVRLPLLLEMLISATTAESNGGEW